MSDIIDKQILKDEILVRFLFDTNFKKKISHKDKIIDGEVFLDLRGVSLQRERYCTENKCKQFANNIPKKFAGFVVFRKKHFEEIKSLHKEKREDFEAIIKSTPLNEDNEYIPEDVVVYTSTLGNPAHCDLVYINPSIDESQNESPKIAIRSFSRKLYRKSILIIDERSDDENYLGEAFKNVV